MPLRTFDRSVFASRSGSISPMIAMLSPRMMYRPSTTCSTPASRLHDALVALLEDDVRHLVVAAQRADDVAAVAGDDADLFADHFLERGRHRHGASAFAAACARRTVCRRLAAARACAGLTDVTQPSQRGHRYALRCGSSAAVRRAARVYGRACTRCRRAVVVV